jgi:hypothetical protein
MGLDVNVPPSPVEPITPDNSNLALGIVGGAVAAAAGAVLWAAVTNITHLQIGWMAVGIGALVGLAVRKLGRGSGPVFGVAGAVLALLGCVAGNLLTVCLLVAHEQKVGVLEIVSRLDPPTAAKLLVATFSGMDVIFYALAVYEGYKLSMMPPGPDAAAPVSG